MAMRCPCFAVRVLLPKTEPEPTSSGYLPPGVAARIAGGEVPQNVDGPVFDSSTGLTSQGIASRYEGRSYEYPCAIAAPEGSGLVGVSSKNEPAKGARKFFEKEESRRLSVGDLGRKGAHCPFWATENRGVEQFQNDI